MESPHRDTHNNASAADNVVQAQNVHGDVHIHSGSIPADTRVVPHQLPATVRHFINRTVEQDALTTLLKGSGDDHTVLVSTIDGLAGVGKSTLVVRWAHQVREQFTDGELYVNLRGFDPAADPMTPGEALTGFLTALGVAPEAIPASEQARAAQFRTLLHGRRMLLVLDNARDTEQVLPLLPGSPGCLAVVTSRQRLDGLVAHHAAQRLALTTLTHAEGRELLERYLGPERVAEAPETVAALLEHCAGLPLALTLVAVQAAAEPDIPLKDFAADLRDERDRLDALDAGGQTGIRAVFSWSYRTLTPEAARLFRLLGLPNSPDIGVGAAAALAGTDTRSTRRLLAELCRAHLLTRRADDRYVFHDLLRAYARERAHSEDTENDRNAAIQRLLDHYLYTVYAVNHRLRMKLPLPELQYTDDRLLRDFSSYDEALAWWDVEHPSVLATIRQTATLGFARSPTLARAASYPFKLRGLLSELHTSSAAGLVVARSNGDRLIEAQLLGDTGAAHHFFGQFDEAIRYHQAAGRLFAELGEHYWEAISYLCQGESWLEQSCYTDAATVARRALELEPDLVGADAVLGLALAHLGNFDAAFTHLRRSLSINDNEHTTSYTLNSLGTAYFLAGQVDKAVQTFHQATELRRSVGQRLGEAESLTKLGEALAANGDTDGARESWQAALNILDKHGHPDVEVVQAKLNALDTAS